MRVRPVFALYAFVVGLPLHNLVMAELYEAGVRGAALDVAAAWKEALLVAALAWVAVDALRTRQLPFRPALVDILALAFAAVVVLYAVIPQSALGGNAGAKAVVFGLRHDLALVAAYFLGRSVRPDLRKLAWTVAAAAAAVAVWGLIDVYAVPLQWWRESGVPGWFRDELGHTYRGLSGLPENFVYNTGDEEHPLRRLVSTFLSPLASSYMLVIALLLLLTTRARDRRLAPALALLIAAGLLWTYARASWAALAVGLLVLALGARRWWPAAAAVAVIGIAIGFAKAYPHIGPETSFTASELRYQRDVAAENPGVSHDPLSPGESSISSHWRNLREGVETVVHHPQGFGLGNAGATAQRFGVPLRAGESSYTELGVETGLAGVLLFIAWSLALLWSLLRGAPVVAAALAAVLALGIQTDVVGVHWLAYCLWWLAGAAARPSPVRVPASFSRVPTLSRREPSQEGVPQ